MRHKPIDGNYKVDFFLILFSTVTVNEKKT